MKRLSLLSTLVFVLAVAVLPQNMKAQETFYQICSTGQRLLYSVIDSMNVKVSGDVCLTGDMEIPSSVTNGGNTYSVTLDYDAFFGCSGLTSVNIPSSVTSIEGRAFSDCSGLTTINIPNSVTSIGYHAFSGCSGLTTINIPNSVTSIDYFAFQDCSGLTTINIPSSVTSIGDFAFRDCSGLTTIDIPSSVTLIAGSAFVGCSGITSISVDANNPIYDSRNNCNAIIRSNDNILLTGCQNTIIPSSVTSIGDFAFFGCNGLTTINIPSSVTSIGDLAFFGCNGLTSISVDANNPIYDSRNNCNAIIRSNDNILLTGCQNTIIPSSVTSIGGSAFSGCNGLTTVNIPNSVTSIGESAFYDCSGLTTINIPNSVTSISYGAFEGCSGLTTIDIPNSVTSIRDFAFSGCSGLTTINIPNSVTSIRGCAFSGCSGLTTINIPSSVTSIVVNAFSGCSGLTSISVDANNPIYDSRNNCNAIIRSNDNILLTGCQNTIIPNSVTAIDTSAFFECSELTFISIPNSVTSIGGYAFYGCSSLDTLFCLANIPPFIDGGICTLFDGASDNFQVFVPCGTIDDYIAAWSSDINFKGFEDYDTVITVITNDTCYLWNDIPYCTSGDYTQTFQTVHGCDSVVTLHLTITVGIDDYNLGASMMVYPNPTTGVVNVQCTMNNVEVGTVEFHVYDAFGRLLRITNGVRANNHSPLQADTHGISVQTAQINLSRYSAGVYFVKAVADGNVIAVRKLIKN